MNQTRPYPPPDSPSSERRGSWLPPFVFLLGLCAWIGAGAIWSLIDDAEGVDLVRYQTLAIVLAVIGAGLVVIATLYDVTSRWR